MPQINWRIEYKNAWKKVSQKQYYNAKDEWTYSQMNMGTNKLYQ